MTKKSNKWKNGMQSISLLKAALPCWSTDAIIDLLSKYLGTRVFDWSRGNFHLARSPLYRERSGKLEVFSKTTTRDWEKTAQNLSVSKNLSWGIQEKLLHPLRLFAGSFLLHPFPTGRWSLCCGESLSKGQRDSASGFQPVSKFCWTRNRCGCDFFNNCEDFSQWARYL